jgi:hypothetical protein
MASKSLHNDFANKWIDIANLLAEEPHAPVPEQAERDLLERVVSRLRRIPLRNWPTGLLKGYRTGQPGMAKFVNALRAQGVGGGVGTVLLLKTEADAEVDPRAVYELAYSVSTALAKILFAFSDQSLARSGQMIVLLPRPSVGEAVLLEASGRMRSLPRGDYAQFLGDLELVDDVRRIRRCPICPRFFFAERSDQTACSRSHAKTLSMQKWRRGLGKDYEQQRKERLWKQDQQANPKQASTLKHQQRRKPIGSSGGANGEIAKTRTK